MNYADYKAKGNNFNKSLLAPEGAIAKSKGFNPGFRFKEESIRLRKQKIVRLIDLKQSSDGRLRKRIKTSGGLPI